jgi:hypothetical protein
MNEKQLIDRGLASRDPIETTELNPNHPVTQKMRTEWHTIAAILLMKLVADERRPELEITMQDVRDLAEMNGAIVIDARGDKLMLRLLDNAEAVALAREAGGLRS